MQCPACRSHLTHVRDTRPAPDGAVRRRRVCDHCGNRFTTYERRDTDPSQLEAAVREFVQKVAAA